MMQSVQRRSARRVTGELLRVANDRSERDQLLHAAATGHFEARRRRDGLFGPGLFADPAWDILLYLAIAKCEGRPVTIKQACTAAKVPDTTGLRTIGYMIDRGLVSRRANPHDGRSAFIQLTPTGKERMFACLAGKESPEDSPEG
jgi:hypothetical protein